MGSNKGELGTFLRSRRARLKPEEAGLQHYGERRRVPGLRREELAQLAGVSVDYYVRFEQGRAENVSDSVVDAVATALRLGPDERAHLYRLVRPNMGSCASPLPPQEVRPGLRRLLDSMPDTPAVIVGRHTDILAWNDLFAALTVDLSALPPGQRNLTWLIFCHEEARSRYVDWETKARELVAHLRVDHGRHLCDADFAERVARLSEESADFRRLWADQEVREKTHGTFHLRHPAVGELTLAYETLRLADDPDQALIVHTAEAGSPSEAALRIIGRRMHHYARASTE